MSAKPSRFIVVDSARGLCLVWMTIAHVLSHIDPTRVSWLARAYPSGWSTTNFVMLTGLALALIGQRRSAGGKIPSWRRRALQILGVAYVTNALIILGMTWHDGVSVRSILAQSLGFQHPWTINGILLPTFCLLLSAPLLHRIATKIGPGVFLAGITLVDWSLWNLLPYVKESIANGFVFSSLFVFDNVWFGFPLGHLFGLGVWAYALGTWVPTRPQGLLFAMVFLTGLYGVTDSSPFLLYLFRFGGTLLLAQGLSSLQGLSFVNRPLMLLGRSSLLVFIVHQFLLQASVVLAPIRLPPQAAPALLIGILTLCLVLCWTKERVPRIAQILGRVGF